MNDNPNTWKGRFVRFSQKVKKWKNYGGMRVLWKALEKGILVVTVFLAAFATLLCTGIIWMFRTWTNLTMEELVYHLTGPLEGTSTTVIWSFLRCCVVPSVLVFVLLVVVFTKLRKRNRVVQAIEMGVVGFSLLFSGSLTQYAWQKLEISAFAQNQSTYSTFIDENYVDPRSVELQFPDKKRNLIYIFLESMEMTYADEASGGAFEENYIKELTKLAQDNEDFSGDEEILNGGYSMPGSTWTIAAMFSQMSGLPLSISIEDNAMDTQQTFFSDVVALGDILDTAGYRQMLMIGSDATFGGRRLFFTEHGGYTIWDHNYAVGDGGVLPEDYRVWWGYEDEKLFAFARQQLEQMSESEQPFNLTLLTVDTHFEDGYLCPECPNTYGENQYANVIACASRQVDEFVHWVQQQDFYENTTIVLVGDHPTMDSDFCQDVSVDYTRKVYVSYINSAVSAQTNDYRNYTTMDCFPTTLASLDVEIEGDRLGLGTNLFSDTWTISEQYGVEKVSSELKKKSQLMEQLAQINEDSPELLIRTGRAPAGDVSAVIRPQGEMLSIDIINLRNLNHPVSSVTVAAWAGDDQSDLQWIEAEERPDGTYYAEIPLSGLRIGENPCIVHVYLTEESGTQYFIGGAYAITE